MPRFTLSVDNLRGLRSLRWSPEGVSVLVGANGAGKTTALLTLKLLRTALDRGLPEAVRLVFGGSHGLKHRDALDDEAIEVTVDLDDLTWSFRLDVRQATADALTAETLTQGDREIFRRDSLGGFTFGDTHLRADHRLGLRALLDSQLDAPEVERMATFIRGISVFHDPDLFALRGGCDATQSKHLHSRGQNALTMLRGWLHRKTDRSDRYDFVLKGLQTAFPGLIDGFDFIEAGNTLAADVYRPGREHPEPLGAEANGVLAMLVLLCDLAAANEGGVVAIDQPTIELHPFAVRAFARIAERRALQKRLIVILTTHSTVLLDHFNGSPEQVYVLDPAHTPGPTRLTDLKNPAWLEDFRLGELYAAGSIATNDAQA